MCISQLQYLSLSIPPAIFCLGNHTFVFYIYDSISVLLVGSFLPFSSFLDCTYKQYHGYVSLSDLLHSVCQSLGPSVRLQMALFSYFLKFSSLPAALGPPCCASASSSCKVGSALQLRCASHCNGFYCYKGQALGRMGFRSCCSWAQLCGGMWTPPGPGIKPLAPALADAFLTSHHQGSPISFFFNALVIFHCVFVPHLYPLMDIQVISMPWLLQSGCVFYLLSVCNPITSW